MKLLITVDYSDGDYLKDLIEISEEEFNKFKPLIDAIDQFSPYICHHEYGGIAYHNWESAREDLGQKSLYETYSQFPETLIDEFQERFLSIHNPGEDYGGTFHTIVELRDVITDKVYIDWDYEKMEGRKSDKIKAFEKEEQEIRSYRRGKDGKPLCSIPFNEMTDEESELVERLDNLWKKYI